MTKKIVCSKFNMSKSIVLGRTLSVYTIHGLTCDYAYRFVTILTFIYKVESAVQEEGIRNNKTTNRTYRLPIEMRCLICS